MTTAAALANATLERGAVGEPFALDGECIAVADYMAFVADGTGGMLVGFADGMNVDEISAGDRVSMAGVVYVEPKSLRIRARATNLVIRTHGQPRPPVEVTAAGFVSGKYDYLPVRLHGRILDVLNDDIDSRFAYALLESGGERIPVSLKQDGLSAARKWIGCEAEVTGICNPTLLGARIQIGRMITHPYLDNPLVRVTGGRTDPFDVPTLREYHRLNPMEFARLGRHRTTGEVEAVWNGDGMLLRTAFGRIVKVTTDGGELPECGEVVEVSGFPVTDLFSVNLVRAKWRAAKRAEEAPREPAAKPEAIAVRDIFVDPETGRERYFSRLHGRVVRISGEVRMLPSEPPGDRRLYLNADGFSVPVEIGASREILPSLSVGCRVSVTGVCVMEIDSWSPNVPLPGVKGVLLVTRRPDDLVVLSRPSWWTPMRLVAVIAVLAVIVVAVLIWTLILKRLAERRGRELAAERIAHAEADFRTEERTRLAVELHDSIAQNLTGVAMELETVEAIRETGGETFGNHLSRAERTLDSCRRELRNCLWDLRNRSLEDPDLAAAIRTALLPHVKGVRLDVRFPVPRERVSDPTAHAMLRIIRELAVNAIRHGGATAVRIAGAIEGNVLMFSVKDNGRGFEPEKAPGVMDGHFGLQGIRERVETLGGGFAIESAPGTGARAEISIPMRGEAE